MVAAAALTSSCDLVTFKSNQQGSVSFEGINAVEREIDGTYTIFWTNGVSSNDLRIKYQVYAVDLGPNAAPPVDGRDLPLKGNRKAALTSYALASMPPDTLLLKTMANGELAYKMEAALNPAHAYLLVVKATDDKDFTHEETNAAYLSADLSASFYGCLKGVATGPTTARLELEYPESGQELAVFRDGVRVFSSDSATVKVFEDTGLKPGKEYKYSCEAKVGTETWVGITKPVILTPDPMAEFVGCSSGKALGYDSIEVSFPFPSGAEKVMVFRDGIAAFGSTSGDVVSFTDTGLSPAKTYEYTCEVHVGNETKIGATKLKLTTKDPREIFANSPGCLAATGLDSSRIKVDFELPAEASSAAVYRDGVEIFTSTNAAKTTFTDSGLEEGQRYEYSCEFTVGTSTIKGTNVISARTLTTNPPTFGGITSAATASPSSVKLRWGVSSGVATASFKVYGNLGSTLLWTAEPIKTVPVGSLEAVITDLGDELPYIFGVRACSEENICDDNTVTRAISLADRGASTNSGAASVSISNGALVIKAPWSGADGAIASRRVYQRTGATAGTNIADYSPVLNVSVADVTKPPTDITLTGLTENLQYNLIVRDVDPSGNENTNTNIVSLTTGDLTPPSFSGITGLANAAGNLGATALVASFSAISNESNTGASHYQIYVNATGANACTSGTLHQEFASTNYTDGTSYTYTISGLTPRTNYSVCLKARDASGNVSMTTSVLARTTLDVTPPLFDGIQTLTFSNQTQLATATWNPSPSSDILEYKIRVWQVLVGGATTAVTTLTRSHAAASTGFSLSSTDYAMTGGATLHMVVDACDTAGAIPGGTQNCTVFATTASKSLVLPDLTPPANFNGVDGPNTQPLAGSEGQMTVAWYSPSGDWSGYRGFEIYHVVDTSTDPDTVSVLKNCPCSANNCPLHETSCSVTGLDPYRTYRFLVRAYDEAGNRTNNSSYQQRRTLDQTAPAHSSNLAATFNDVTDKVDLTFSAATDNQYSSEPGVALTYLIYRAGGQNCASPVAPSTSGAEYHQTTSLAYSDASINGGESYTYRVCARDTSNNKTCDSIVRCVATPDITPPTVSNFVSDKTTEGKSWTLSWTMSDNLDGTPNLSFEIRRIFSASATPPVVNTTNFEAQYPDTPLTSGLGATTYGLLSGPADTDTYIHYLLVVRDTDGNTALAQASVYSQNALTITSVSRNQGSTAGGKMIVLTGTGFVTGTTVKVGDVTCASPFLIKLQTTTKLGCTTGAHAAGAVNVTVTNPDTTSKSLVGGYTYTDSGTGDNVCNGTLLSPFQAGSGTTAADPYIICSRQQLQAAVNGNFYKLGDHLDLGYPLPGVSNQEIGGYQSTFDGGGYLLANYKNGAPNEDTVSLLYAKKVTNLGIVNVDLQGRFGIGPLRIYGTDCSSGVSDVFSTGTISARANVGGAIVGDTGGYYVSIANTWSSVTIVLAAGEPAIGGEYQEPGAGGIISKTICNITGASYSGGITVTGSGGYAGGNVDNHTFASGGIAGQVLNGGGIADSSSTGSIVGNSAAGGLVGYVLGAGDIQNSHSTMSVSTTGYHAGGLVGLHQGSGDILASYATGAISGGSSGVIGGLVGVAYYSSATISDSQYEGPSVSAPTGNYVGGLIGAMVASSVIIEDSHSTGSISGISWVGGLVGSAGAGLIVRSSYASGSVTGSGDKVGGLIGEFSAGTVGSREISKSYATGNVSGRDYVGGLMGRSNNGGDISDSYARGNVVGQNYVGSLVGSTTLAVTNSYATGTLTQTFGANASLKGGINGDSSTSPTITGSFWNTTVGPATSNGGGTGKTTTQLQTESTFTAAGWDFTPGTGVWEMPSGSGYPVLNWQTP